MELGIFGVESVGAELWKTGAILDSGAKKKRI
jgi:hypothetical protein